jgi:putative DNA primase/helicase
MDGSQVLDEVAATLSRYLALPDGAADAMALWIAHTHCFDAFENSPRLNLTSPEKGCGKTTARDVLGLLVPRPLSTENLTAAVLFRVVEKRKPTVLADECDTWLWDNEELRGMFNTGHRRGGQALRCEGENHEVRAFRVFGPAVLCGIGELPGTLHDRSIRVCLVRAKPGEVRVRFDSRRINQEGELCRKLARWAADNHTQLRECDPRMPESAFNRLADNWRPLFAIAEIAGGDWPRRATKAFADLTKGEDLDSQGIGTTLLADVARAFERAGVEKLASTELVKALIEMEGQPWAEFGKHAKAITANQLARQLKKFKVAPRTIKLEDGTTAKGYHREDFCEAFDRFLPVSPISKRNLVTDSVNTGDLPLSETSPAESGLRMEGSSPACKNGVGYTVTVPTKGDAEDQAKWEDADLL